jgi:tRNA pseudouridine55 synthase
MVTAATGTRAHGRGDLFLVVDKPVGPSSFDVVRRVKRALARCWGPAALRGLKLGHGGTLDPLASGVLPICIGEGTKLAPFLLDADKEYQAAVAFGVETDTMDAAGTVTATAPTDGLDADVVRAALARFTGVIEQVPPMYSALKRDGRPLYSYARAGQEVERQARRVTVHALTLEAWEPPARAHLGVRCSKGTYVRVLAADLGRALGAGAHLCGLRRTASGPFHLGQSIGLDELDRRAAAGGPEGLPLVPLVEALAHLPALRVGADVAYALTCGQIVTRSRLGLAAGEGGGRYRALREDGSLLAIVELEPSPDVQDPRVRSLRVFAKSDARMLDFPPRRGLMG